VDGDKLLTIKQVAEELKVTTMTVRRYIEAGRITYERPGREYLIWQSEVERFKQTRRGPGRPPKGTT
jgi:excisionase family DNA binding protein